MSAGAAGVRPGRRAARAAGTRPATRSRAPVATPAPRPRPARARTAPRTARRSVARARPRVRVGRLIVPLIALLLAGIVWVNVATLSLTTATGQVVEDARGVEAETVRLRGELEQRNGAVGDMAREELGMIEPPPETVRFLDVPTATP